MWTRVELKNQCKQVMSRSYGKMLLISLFTSAVLGFVSFDITEIINNANIIALLSLCFILLDIFCCNPIVCGSCRFYTLNSAQNAKFSEIFYAFRSDQYWNVVKIMFFQKLKIFLWTLLFLVPGIIKAYEYSMIPYLLAENPGMDMNEAFSRTKEMTQGQKLNMFILDLSFAGWYIAGMITLGLILIMAAPYIYGVQAELYLKLKANSSVIY